MVRARIFFHIFFMKLIFCKSQFCLCCSLSFSSLFSLHSLLCQFILIQATVYSFFSYLQFYSTPHYSLIYFSFLYSTSPKVLSFPCFSLYVCTSFLPGLILSINSTYDQFCNVNKQWLKSPFYTFRASSKAVIHYKIDEGEFKVQVYRSLMRDMGMIPPVAFS